MTQIAIGQIWKDNDKRIVSKERTVRVEEVDEQYAYVRDLSNNRRTRIRKDRFKPNSTGYILLKDVEEKAHGNV